MALSKAALDKHDEDRDAIEAIMDRQGIDQLLLMVSDICNDKSDHITTNWQDADLAEQWGKIADELDNAAGVAHRLPGLNP